MAGAAERRFSDRERAAVALAFVTGELTSPEVARRAREGRLVDGDGRVVEAFDVAPTTVRTIGRRARRSGVVGAHGALDVPQVEKLYAKLGRWAASSSEMILVAADGGLRSNPPDPVPEMR